MSTSFPFLKIAREHGADYGAVLLYSNALVHGNNYWTEQAAKKLTREVKIAVLKATREEMERQHPKLNFSAWGNE